MNGEQLAYDFAKAVLVINSCDARSIEAAKNYVALFCRKWIHSNEPLQDIRVLNDRLIDLVLTKEFQLKDEKTY